MKKGKILTRCFAFVMAVLMVVTTVDFSVLAEGEVSANAASVPADSEYVKTFTPLKNGSASAERQKYKLSFRQSDFQLTGLLFKPKMQYKVTVTGLAQNDPLPSIALSQNMEHFGEDLVSTVKLNDGERKTETDGTVTVSKTIASPSDSYPGAIYIVNPYTSSQQTGDVKVTIQKVDESVLDWYPVYNNSDTDTISKTTLEEFQNQLKEYKKLMDDENSSYPQYVDLCSDRILISTSFDAAYDMYVENHDDRGKEFNETPDSVLQRWGDSVESMYEYANISKEDFPKMRQQVRAIGRNYPFFATNGYIGFDNGVPEHYSYEILKSSFVDGWGALHELGHVIENHTVKYVETTNNLYVMDRIINDLGGTNRLKQEKRYDHFFSTISAQKNNLYFYLYDFEVGNANYNLEQLSIWDRLVMIDQLNQYFRQNDTQDPKREFWSEITEAARNITLSGYQVNDALNKIVLYAADVFGVDIRPIFHISNMDARFIYFTELYRDGLSGKTLELVESLDSLPKIPATVRYIDETYADNATKKLADNTSAVIGNVESKGTSNKLTIHLSDESQAENLLGYEIYRMNSGMQLNRDNNFIGYAKAKADGTATFSDTLNVAAYQFDYYAVPVSKDLSEGTVSEKYTTSGQPAEAGELQITEVTYNQMVDELSVKGTGYSPTNNGNDAYMQIEANGKTYDIIEDQKTELKEYVHFIPGDQNTWEIRVTDFSTREESMDIDIVARYLEHQKRAVPDLEEFEDVYMQISNSGNILYNLGDIAVSKDHSPLLKTVAVEGIKGNVTARFDPMNLDYTGDKKYVKTSLSEINSNPEVTIFTDTTAKMKLVPELADIHADYEIYVTPYSVDEKGELSLDTSRREKQLNSSISLEADRDSTAQWRIEICVTDRAKDTAEYSFDLYSPNENSYFNSFSVDNGVENKASSIKISNDGFRTDYLLITREADSAQDNNNPVRMSGTTEWTKATVQYYYKSDASGIIDGEYNPDGGLTTENLINGAESVKVCVTAEDGVTSSEYKFITKLSDEAKKVANLKGVEITGQLRINGFVKQMYTNTDESTKELFDEICYISPTVDGTTEEMYIAPVIDYYTSGEESSGCQWDVLRGSDKSSVALKESKITCGLSEGDKTLVITSDELKKSAAGEGDTFNPDGENLRLTITSPDGTNTKRILFCYSASDDSPLQTGQNVSGNIALYNWASYTPENAVNAYLGNIDKDIFDYTYILNDEAQTYIRFSPVLITDAADNGVVEQYIDGIPQTVTPEGATFIISTQATGFSYKLTSPDGSKQFTYRFNKYFPTDSKLADLTVNGYMVHEDENGNYVTGFDPSVTEYYMLTNNLDNIEVKSAASDAEAAIVTTLDGKAKDDINAAAATASYARSRSYEEVMQNNSQTGQTKELEVNVMAQSNSTTTYNITVSDKFDFFEEPDFITEDQKTALNAGIEAGNNQLSVGNFDDTLYKKLQTAVNNATALAASDYAVKSECTAAIETLNDATTRYSELIQTLGDYVTLYNEIVVDDRDKSVEADPNVLRKKLYNHKTGGASVGTSGKFIMREEDGRYVASSNNHPSGKDKKMVFYVGNDATPKNTKSSFAGGYAVNLTEIGANAFKGFYSIQQITLGDKVTKISYGAFEGCTSLATISSLNSIELANRAFWNTKIGIGTDNNPNNTETNYVPKDKVWIQSNNQLAGSSALPSGTDAVLSIPEGTTEIAPYAFHGMKSVTVVMLPYGMNKIGTGAFINSSPLKSVIFLGDKISVNGVFDSSVTVDRAPEYTVTLSQSGSDGNLNLRGAGTYEGGSQATLVAPSNNNYQFVGWKYAEADENCFSTSPAIRVTVTKDINAVAVYEAAPTYTLTVEYDEATGTVKADEAEISEHKVTEKKYGDSVVLKAEAGDDYQFGGWYALGRQVSSESEYTVIVQGNQTIEAKFTPKNQYVVTFKDVDGKIFKISSVIEGNAAEAPTNISRPGYVFDKWDQDFQNVTSNMMISAVWKKDTALKYEITAVDGVIYNGSGAVTNKFGYNERVQAVANPAPRGFVFSHWEDESGKLISYDATYIFGAVGSIKLKAIYAKDAKAMPVVLVNSVLENATTKKVSFICQVTVPQGYEKVECGLVVFKNTEPSELTLNTAGAIRGRSPAQNSSGQYSITVGMANGGTVYARAYLTYRDTATGETITIYSDGIQSRTVVK